MVVKKKKKAAVLFSGGKDSCLAFHLSAKKFNIVYLLSIIPDNFDSFMFHKPYLELLERQAESLDKDLVVMGSKGEEEKEVDDLRKLISKVVDDIDVIVVGGIASNYQGKRVKKICNELGLEFYAPLWDYKDDKVWKELFKRKFKVILTKVSCDGLGKQWLGEVIDEERFKELKKLSKKYKFRIDFEGGEAESAVLFMPDFKKEIYIRYSIKSEGEYRHFIDKLKIV